MLNNFAEILTLDSNNDIQVLLNNYGQVSVPVKREDKKTFFEHFS